MRVHTVGRIIHRAHKIQRKLSVYVGLYYFAKRSSRCANYYNKLEILIKPTARLLALPIKLRLYLASQQPQE